MRGPILFGPCMLVIDATNMQFVVILIISLKLFEKDIIP